MRQVFWRQWRESRVRTLLFQSVGVRQPGSGILVVLMWVLHVVVSLQSASNVAGVVAVSTAKWLQRQTQAPQRERAKERRVSVAVSFFCCYKSDWVMVLLGKVWYALKKPHRKC